MTTNIAPDHLKKRVLILGCGNLLFGDDGFGPATVEYIRKNCDVPYDVEVMDVGTGTSMVLLELALSEEKPEKIIILDAVNIRKKPGEIFQLSIENLPASKTREFSRHLFPATNLLKEIRDGGVEVVILACQVEKMPEVVSSGLSKSVERSVPKAARMALELAKIGKS